MGLKPSNGGSLTLQIFAGGGLGELRPEGSGASAVAEGAIALGGLTWRKLEMATWRKLELAALGHIVTFVLRRGGLW